MKVLILKNLHLVIRNKLQKDTKDFYSFGGVHIPPASFTYKNITTPIPILSKDYLIYEKRELLRDFKEKTGHYNEKTKNNNGHWVMKSVEHKEVPWSQQLKLLEENEMRKKMIEISYKERVFQSQKRENKKKKKKKSRKNR